MRRGWLELVVVLMVATLLGWTLRPSAPPAASPQPARSSPPSAAAGDLDRVTVQGIAPGDRSTDVHLKLGEPPRSGALTVDNGAAGRWEEYGPGAGCTWEGRPTISYRADQTVLAVCGHQLEIGGQTLGEGTSRECFDRWLGPPRDASATSIVYVKDGPRLRKQLTVSFSNDRATRVVFSSEQPSTSR